MFKRFELTGFERNLTINFLSTTNMKFFWKYYLLFFLLIMSFCCFAKGQQYIRQLSFTDSTLKFQADSIKKEMSSHGFIVVKEAPVRMESGYEMPVIVPLTQGTWYDFVFIGDISSRLYEVRMFDYNDKQVVYEKHYGEGVESNVINFSYIPKLTEYHIIKPVQVNKKKKENISGYIIMFKKVI